MRFRSRLLAALGGAFIAASVLAAAPALAAQPVDVGPGPVVDGTAAGALFDDAALAQATAAIDALADRTGLALTVVFVDDFSGMHPTDWANATAQSSGRTQPADVLLAIATTARGFGVSVDPGIGLSDAQLSAAENADLLPRLQQNDWAGAVEAYARALGDLRTGDDTGSAAIRGDTGGGSTAWILPTVTTVLLVVLGGAFLVAYLRGRRRNG